MPDTYRVKLSDGREFDVTTEGGPPSEQDVLSNLNKLAPSEPQGGPQGSAAGRFLSNLGETLNPITAVQGLVSAVRHPLDTITGIAGAQIREGQQAIDMAKQGRYSEATGHGVAALLPLVGPAAAQAGEQIGSGDVAGGLGKGVGLLVPAMAPTMVRGAAKAAKVLPEGAASAVESAASKRIVDVMAPKVGPNKLRYGNMAEKVAPEIAKDLAKEGAPLTREGLHAQVAQKLEQAQNALDAATDARGINQVETGPIVARINEQIKELTAEPIEASKVPRSTVPPGAVTREQQIGGITGEVPESQAYKAQSFGEPVEPAPNQSQIGTLVQIRDEIKRLGPLAPYDAVRRIRQAWDQVAKVKFMPSTATDALKAQGDATAAVKGTGAIREALAASDPRTAVANAQYSLYKTAKDVMDATAEVERARPRVGRAIMTRLTATLAGGQAAGVPGSIAGYAFAPAIEAASAMGLTTQLKTAALFTRLAGAIRRGDVEFVGALSARLKRLQAASLTGRTTNPSESPTPLTPALGRP